ncbi:Hypothetical protein HVPorG_03980 [Roseomonas mucosa]|nr:Hypothetical protein HVPorG_03980 [Roseomonas mucosa]
MDAVVLRPDPWKQVAARGCRKEERHPVCVGGTGSLPESHALRRDPASASASEREVQDPQGPGGWGVTGAKAEPSPRATSAAF